MAYVLIQHLDPKRESGLRDILARSTTMPVREVASSMPVEPDSVYVIPPNAGIGLVNGIFNVVPRPRVRGREMPIDYFFNSLAEQYKSRAIGVVLSGTLSDGALGLRAIKSEGGVTFAQDQKSARFQDMPRAAIAAGSVDFVLPPETIARELARMGQHPYVRLAARKAAEKPVPKGSDHQKILAMLRVATGVNFSGYRQTTIKRRISRRVALRKVESVKEYLELLRKEKGEVRALYDDILITVTGFFRDPSAFQALKTMVFPALVKERPVKNPIRIWVPGCSTGEEVYSIAIVLFESLLDRNVNPTIQMFATDVSERAIETARTGIYLENSMVDVSPERLKRFFVKADGGWQISKTIRDVCVFAKQNVTADPPFSNMDLISCRNLLIYMEPVLQKRIIPLFHYALKPNGFLLLGNAESITGFETLFSPLDRNQRIFVKRQGSPRQFVDFARHRPEENEKEPAAVEALPGAVAPLDLQKEADRLVLGRYGPAGVLINESFEILHFRGRTSPYLEAAPGTASFNLLKMAREGLLVELRTAVQRAKKSGRPVRKEGLRIRQDNHSREVNLEVVPLKGDAGERHFLILFEEAGLRRRDARPDLAAEKKRAPSGRGHQAIVRLEQELAATKEYLQATIEEQEASNEELKSANEEILSSNEELQSTNEELETAKEELQSTNEELRTVNDELQNRNTDLSLLNNDLSNLVMGSNMAVVMLDVLGRIRRFTPLAERLLNLVPGDVGRPIRDIKPNVPVPDLQDLAMEVIRSMGEREREVQDREGNWYQMKVRPYRTLDNRIDGAVIAFMDIDPIKRSLEQIHRARDYAEALVETVRESLVVLDDHLRVRTANQVFYRTFQTSSLKAEGRPLFELPGWDRQASELRDLVQKVSREKSAVQDRELELELESGHAYTLVLNARPVRFPADSRTFVLLAIEDVTERRSAEMGLRASEARYRRIFESAREGIWLLDARGEILDINPYLLELLGYGREELVGRKPWDAGLYPDAEGARERFQDLLERGVAFQPRIEMRSKTGEALVFETIKNVSSAGGQRIAQYNMRDLTERLRLEDQLRQVQKLDSIGTLAGGVAHDFRNLLNIIAAHVGLLKQGEKEDARRQESVQAIEKAIERGSAVVGQLLTFARRTDVSFESVDVNEIVTEVAGMLKETFPKQIHMELDLDPKVPPVRADPNQLHQAILNLAVNARDAMPDGGRLRLQTGTVAGNDLRETIPGASLDRYVCLNVSDDGKGMDQDTRRRLFEPFFTTKKTGRGLGLAVVYGIVNGHRGHIGVESSPGTGTTFRICLPAPSGNDNAKKKAKKAAAYAETERHAAGSGTLLLVEDEEMLLAPIKTLLEGEGYRVLAARDGDEAVRVFTERSREISAVIMDLGLPGLTGEEAFFRMQEANPAVKCIVASGTVEARRMEELRKAGVYAALRKPYGAEEILRALRSAMEH